MGIWCAHSYPHTSEDIPLNALLPRSLKGSDLMFYAIFESLGMGPKVSPIFFMNDWADKQTPKKEYSVFVGDELMPFSVNEMPVQSELGVSNQVRPFNVFCRRISTIFSTAIRHIDQTSANLLT